MNNATALGRTPLSLTEASGLAGPALIGRVLISMIFLLSGFGKVADPQATLGYIASAGLPMPKVALAIAVSVEVIGGLLLLAGYRARTTAAVLAAFSLAAAFGFHFQLADQNQFIHFFKNVAMAGGLMQVVAFGSGRLGVDGR